MLNLIGEDWIEADSGDRLEVRDPATDDVVGSVPFVGRQETAKAVECATSALTSWANIMPDARYQILKTYAGLILDNSELLSETITAECGKPLAEATGEVALGAAYLEWAAEEGRRLLGQILSCSVPGKRLLAIRRPAGVVGAITPWNFPVALVTRKIGPALAAGCTVVLKPSEKAPLSSLLLGEIALQAGLPGGVLNVLTGDPGDVVEELLDQESVRVISFTGSNPVGKWLVQRSEHTLTRIVLELGGNAPFIVFDDADLEKAIADAVTIKFRNAGQTCVAASRFLVQRGVYEEFLKSFSAAAGALRVGNGREFGVNVGPLIDDAAVDKIRRQLRDAIDRGARLVLGGSTARRNGPDRYFCPTVLDGWTDDMLVNQEEIFGPVASFRVFEDESEAIRVANNNRFGLAGYAYTRDPSRAFRILDNLECGIIGINDVNTAAPQVPLGGMKESGWGKEGGSLALDTFLDVKYADWRP
jgi:succinate-semialdehyde dehydrogenase/glutarate-semialdehyde dehydrogenase